MLQLPGVGHVVARLVLGQDFHQWTQLQPPLLLRDPVAEGAKHEVFFLNVKTTPVLSLTLKIHPAQKIST